MTDKKSNQAQVSAAQFAVNFILPTISLLWLSDKSRLGPTKALLLALAFPIVFELYSVVKNKKISMLSVISIIGIIVTGAVTLLGLSENWLAIRRSVVYVAGALIILISMWIKRPLLQIALNSILDVDTITAAAAKHNKQQQLQRRITITSYALALLLLVIGGISYILTLVIITAPANTTVFNTEYVRLRVLSIAVITVPLLIGIMAILTYLLTGLEKMTGIPADKLVKKKSS